MLLNKLVSIIRPNNIASRYQNKPEFIISDVLSERIYLEFLKNLDKNRYLDKNTDIALALENNTIKSIDSHFRNVGMQEIYSGTRVLMDGLEPFNEEDYADLGKNSQVPLEEKALLSPFEYYLIEGYKQILSTQNDTTYILPDILRTSVYLEFLSALDKVAYLTSNTDLLTALDEGTIDNIDTHFRQFGMGEIYHGVRTLFKGLPFYDEEQYLALNQDLLPQLKNKHFISGFEHFLLYGHKEVHDGLRLINPEAETPYIKSDPDELNRALIEQSGMFDAEFYRTYYPDIRTNEVDPLWHYIVYGAEELRNPSATFSTTYYLNAYPEVLQSGINPLVHYILVGEKEKRKTVGKNIGAGEIKFHKLPLVSNHGSKITLKIAVVIHAFYIDVLEDIISSIDYIVPQPDLFISVSKEADVGEIEALLNDRGYKNYVIRPVQNRGRDVAPLLAEFSGILKSYDLCCKIHGKKSLYAGSEQTNWRNHLYHNLLGSKEIVDDILSAFAQNKKLGLLFSDNYGMIPYWGYTWLTNKGVSEGLLYRLNLQQLNPILKQTYIDYPAGTMFWFRPEAIQQILDSDISYEDFPEEPIGNDGTLAHGLERLFGYVTRLNGFEYIEQNWHLMQYTKNITHKNFNQHEAKTLETAKRIISEKTCVIFDIFDTLVTRTIFYPDNLFRIIEKEFDQKFSIKSDFMRIRKATEYQLRISETHVGDVSYDDIYDHIHLHSNYTEEMIEYLREQDFKYEMKILVPKPDAIVLLKHAFNNNIEVLFVSDMYLTKLQILSILEKNDIPFIEENVLVSSDTGLRKDNTTVWKHLVETERVDPSNTVMIGDSEVSDAKLPGDFGIGTFHVLSERNAFFESPFGKAFTQKFGEISEKEMLLMGPVVNQFFSSAFTLSESVLSFSHKCTPYQFGYTALAPFFYLFMNHIYHRFSDKRIFFLARDGYFMQKTFDAFLETKALTLEGEAHYLQISRRAILGAVLKNEDNLKNMILDLGNYDGLFSDMLYSRVGLGETFLSQSGIEDFMITDRDDLEHAYTLLVEHIDLINEYAKEENVAYLAYLDSIGFFDESEDVLIDLGYSGTIQNYLHQLTSEKLIGEYFVTTQKVSRIEDDYNTLEGFFANKIDPADNSNTVYKYALILEAFLTSDKGQLISFIKENGTIIPQYKEKKSSLKIQNKIMDGIKDYISALSIVPPDFIDTQSERVKEISLFTFEYIIKNRLLDDELLGLFHLEDEFTGNKDLDIMQILTSRGI